jgi:hypothetical protein
MRAGLCMKPGARACALGKALVIARTGLLTGTSSGWFLVYEMHSQDRNNCSCRRSGAGQPARMHASMRCTFHSRCFPYQAAVYCSFWACVCGRASLPMDCGLAALGLSAV